MRWKSVLLMVLIAYSGVIVALITPHPPANDRYAAYALGIHLYGVYGPATRADTQPVPSMGRAPLYPAFLTAFVALDDGYRTYLECYYSDEEDCGNVPPAPRAAQMLLGLLTVFPLFATARMLGARDDFTALMVLLLMGLWLPWIYLNGVSEALSLPLHALLTYFTARYLFKDTPRRDALLAGLTLGLLALSRFAYQYYLPLLLLILVIGYINRQPFDWRRVGASVSLAIMGFGLLVTPWLMRNQQIFASTTLGTSGSTGVITARVFYNRMTPEEYATAFVYWLPFVGDTIAQRIFPDSHWSRLDVSNPDGFRQQSQ